MAIEQIDLLGDWFYSLTQQETSWELTIMTPSYIWLDKDKKQPISQDIRGNNYSKVLEKGVEILEDFKVLAKKDRKFTETYNIIEV